MTCHVTAYPLFSQRSAKQPRHRLKSLNYPEFLFHSSGSYWTYQPTGPISRLDLTSLEPSVQAYLGMGLADSTQKSYRTASKRFNDFCIKFSINTPFPVSELVLCSFAAYLADDGLKPSSIKVYLAAIRSLQINLGLPDPGDQSSLPRLKRIMAGIARCQLKKGSQTKPRLPITTTILSKIHTELLQDPRVANRTLIWAISSLAFFGFFRLGELIWESPGQYNEATHLSWDDIAVNNRDNPTVLWVHLFLNALSVTKFGQGVDV